MDPGDATLCCLRRRHPVPPLLSSAVVGNYSVHSSIKVGNYAGRLANINLVGINNPIPNLTTVYLDTPLGRQ